jgi:serine protease AprX
MVWIRLVTLLMLIVLSMHADAQKNRYMVFFKDKEGTPFELDQPLSFLSQKAIERRVQRNVEISEQDLPVNPTYVQAVRSTGAEVYFSTRWMNAILVQCESALLTDIENLSFVERIEMVAPNSSLAPNGRIRSPNRSKGAKDEVTDTQLKMIGLDKMHEDGFKGEGMTIAILDAGFSGVNTAEPFSHIFESNKINLEVSKDYVYNSSDIFQYDDHGTEVFSVIGGFQSGSFTGGAPGATFQLYVTEEVPTEYRVEEYNWLFAAERADSAGADIIQSSLGYYDFDLPAYDYLKSQMDGHTAVVTRAAQMAADRGMLVVVSAGNEGNIQWRIITAPADAEDVLAVGSVGANLIRSNSSSTGPTADDRIKPDVAAMGVNTSVVMPSGNFGKASGTSLAAPLITSLAAGVWQKYPALTNIELMDAIRFSASQSFHPDTLLGYGIPNYQRIVSYLEKNISDDFFAVYPNPALQDSIMIQPLFPEEVDTCNIEFISAEGKSVYNAEVGFSRNTRSFTRSLVQFATGLYFVRIKWNGRTFVYRFVKA